jgi:hypothetical protein
MSRGWTDKTSISSSGEDPMLTTHTTAGLDQVAVSIQADWACVWIRVEGPIDKNSIPLVMPVVEDACDRTPRKLILLLQGSTYQQQNLDDLLGQVSVLTRDCGVKLVVQEAKVRQSSGPHRWPRWSFATRRARSTSTT